MRGVGAILLVALLLGATAGGARGQTITPTADGTIVDGGSHGAFDGVGDWADWTFNESGSEGAITLSSGVEQRVVWEFNLAAVSASPPLTAVLTFVLRGAAIFPADPAHVQVVAYPADLLERLTDFSAGPTTLVGEKLVAPFAPPTRYVLDVSPTVNAALAAGIRRVAFRFQIKPGTGNGQAFFDALDSDPATKPSLSIQNRVPGDLDGDGDVDLEDAAKLAGCVFGPGRSVVAACRVCDADLDTDVDLADVETFAARYSAGSHP